MIYPFIPIRIFSAMLTQKCNLNCSYCFEHNKSGKDMDPNRSYDALTNSGKRDVIPNYKSFIIGGEPFCNYSWIEKLNELIKSNPVLTEKHKNDLIMSNNSLITNGTLLDKYQNEILNNNLHLQISLDGTKKAHDSCRVDYNNQGSYDKIVSNIKLLEDKDFSNYSLHGVLSSENYDQLYESMINHIKELRKHNRLLDTCRNLVSLVLEDEITDEQIDTLIEQIYKVTKYILTNEDLNDVPVDLRKQMAINFLSRQGSSICSAGSRMFMLDTSDKVYACHRMNTFNSDDLELYDIKDNEIKNIDFYLSFMKFNSIRYHYGAIRNIDKPNCRDEFWVYICPATSFNVSNSVFTDPAKFNVLQTEVHRAVIQIADYFDLDLTKNTDRIKELRKRGKNKK